MTCSQDSVAGDQPNTSSSISSSLLERVKAQDCRAWQRLVDVYAPLVYRWCRRIGVTADDAPDIVQDVFLAVATNIAGFRRDRSGDSFRGWLWTITRNKICDNVRRQKDEARAFGGSTAAARLCLIPERLPLAPEAEHHCADEVSLAQRVVDLIRPEVEDRTWRAFWRLAVDGHPGPEVAADLGMSLHAVHQAKYRVLQRVRQELSDFFEK